jgi:hypothetical protein
MLHWSEKTTSENIIQDLNKSLKDNSIVEVVVMLEKIPKFLKNEVLLSIFKRQVDNYPKVISFLTSNLTAFKHFADSGFEIEMLGKEQRSEHNVDPVIQNSTRIVIPQGVRERILEEKTIAEGLKNKKIKEIEESRVNMKSVLLGLKELKKQSLVQELKTIKTESVLDNSQGVVISAVETEKESKKKISKLVRPNIRITVSENKRPALLQTKVTVINIPEAYREKQLVLKNKNQQVKTKEFEKITERLIKATEQVTPVNLDIKVKPSPSFEVKAKINKAKSTIGSNINDVFSKKPGLEFVEKVKNSKKLTFAKRLALGCVSIFGVLILSFMYLPSYAYSIEVYNDKIDKNEIIKIYTDDLESKTIELNTFLEKQVPKDKREDRQLARGQVVLYSKGSNSCNITNGGFMVGQDGKQFKVIANPNYYTTVNIPSNSADSSNIVFEVEALGEGLAYNLEKNKILNLLTNTGENLSKNCFAKVSESITNFVLKANEEVTLETNKNLQELTATSLEIKIKEEVEKLKNEGKVVETSLTTKSDFKDVFNNKVGETADTLALSRSQQVNFKIVNTEQTIAKLNKSLDVGKVIKDLKISNSMCQPLFCQYTFNYTIVSKSVDSNRVKEILENSNDELSAKQQIKREFPQVKDVSTTKQGVAIGGVKKIKVN